MYVGCVASLGIWNCFIFLWQPVSDHS